MEKYIYNKENGLHYELIGDYYYPCLTAPEPPCIGTWGMRRLQHLKEHQKILYQILFYTEKLKAHLEEVDQSAEEMFELLVKQLSAIEGVTEELKATDQTGWVAKMNSIHSRVKDVVMQELIYV